MEIRGKTFCDTGGATLSVHQEALLSYTEKCSFCAYYYYVSTGLFFFDNTRCLSMRSAAEDVGAAETQKTAVMKIFG